MATINAAAVLKNINNTGDPFLTPDGVSLSLLKVTFQLVTFGTSKSVSVFDAKTSEHISSKPVTVVANADGEITVDLWPNNRGDVPTAYKVTTNNGYITPFFILVDEAMADDIYSAKVAYLAGTGAFSVDAFMAPIDALVDSKANSAVGIAVTGALADMTAQVNAAAASAGTAESAAITATTSEGVATAAATAAATSKDTALAAAVASSEYKNDALVSKNDANYSAIMAQDWAVKIGSEVVVGDGYSAKHYAIAAAQSASDAALVAGGGVLTVNSRAGNVTLTSADVGLGNVLNVAQIAATEKGAALGVCPLDSGTKIAATYLPDSILGALKYKGVWNAATNSPIVPVATGANTGHYYIVNVSGVTSVDGINDWKVGDWIVSSGTSWSKVDNTDAVSTVFGRAGAIVANAGDYTADQITVTATREFVTPAQKTVIDGIATTYALKGGSSSQAFAADILTVTAPDGIGIYLPGASAIRTNTVGILYIDTKVGDGGSIYIRPKCNVVGEFSATGLTVTGNLSVTGSGSFAAGSMYKASTLGIVLAGATGSSTDFYLGAANAAAVFVVPTGTNKMLVNATTATTSAQLEVNGAVAVLGGISATGDAAATRFIPAAGGAFVAGSIYKNAINGVTITGVTGSTNDLTITTAAGAVLLRNPTGTNSLVTAGDLAVTGGISALCTGAAFTAQRSTYADFSFYQSNPSGSQKGFGFYGGTTPAYRIFMPESGGVLIGGIAPVTSAALEVTGGVSASGNVTGIPAIKGLSGAVVIKNSGSIGSNYHNDALSIGYDSTAGYSWLQSYAGAGIPKPIVLNALSGNVLIGTSVDDGSGVKLQVAGTVGCVDGISIDGKGFVQRYATDSAGTSILNSIFGDVPTCGMLFVTETGTAKYLNASFYKQGSAYAPVLTLHGYYGLAISTSTAAGTQPITGFTVGANVKMKAVIQKVY